MRLALLVAGAFFMENLDVTVINRDTGVVTPKTSYVRKLDPRTLIGCGIYKNLDAATASPVATQTTPPEMRKAA